MSLPPECIIDINSYLNVPCVPAAAANTPELRIQSIAGCLLERDLIGGDCGVVFDNIQNQTTNYLAANQSVTWDDIYDDLYGTCIEATLPPKSQRAGLTFLAYFSTIIIMIGMGCSINIKDCWEHLKRPWGVLVGVFSQFFIMPCIALALAKIFQGVGQISSYQGLIILLMGCSPGGSLSNLMSVWINADVNLSVTMTLCSTILSLGMIPLLLLIMKPAVTTEDLEIPFDSIAITLVMLIGPIILGIVVAYYKNEWAEKIQKVTGVLGLLAIIANIIMAFIMYPKAIGTAGWAMWLIGALFPLIGATFGYMISWAIGTWGPCLKPKEFRHKQFRTVSLETGAQNLRLANTIVQTSFISCPKAINQMLFFPLIYAIFQTTECLLAAAAWKFYQKRKGESDIASLDHAEFDNTPKEGYEHDIDRYED